MQFAKLLQRAAGYLAGEPLADLESLGDEFALILHLQDVYQR